MGICNTSNKNKNQNNIIATAKPDKKEVVKESNHLKEVNIIKTINKDQIRVKDNNISLQGVKEKQITNPIDTEVKEIINEEVIKVIDIDMSKENNTQLEKKIIIQDSPLKDNDLNNQNDINNFSNLNYSNKDDETVKKYNIYQFNSTTKANPSLIYFKDINLFSEDYSNECDFSNIIKQMNIISKENLIKKIISLKERNWISELISINNKAKDYSIDYYLKNISSLNEQFNWLNWAISELYYREYINRNINTDKILISNNEFSNKLEDYGLPQVYSSEWLNGFEWKGVFIRLLTTDAFKNMKQDIKAHKYYFYDYLRILDNKSTKKSLFDLKYQFIFPLVSYSENMNFIIYTSALFENKQSDMSKVSDISINTDSYLLNKLKQENYERIIFKGRLYLCLNNLYSCLPNLINITDTICYTTIPNNSNEENILFTEKELFKNKFYSKEYSQLPHKNITCFIESYLNFNGNNNQEINYHEIALLDSLLFKVYYNKPNTINETNNENFGVSVTKNTKAQDHIINNLKSYIDEKYDYLSINNPLFESQKDSLLENSLVEIQGNSLGIYKCVNNLKFKNSLISNISNGNKVNVNILLDNFAFYLNNLQTTSSYFSSIDNFNNLRERYGINSRLSIFLLFKIKNKKISDLIRISFLLKCIKKFILSYDNINFLIKFLINNETQANGEILLIDNICNSKEKCMFDIFRNKIFYLINIIFKRTNYVIDKDKVISKQIELFNTFFKEKINSILFFKILEIKAIDSKLGIGYINNFDFNLNNIFEDCLSSAFENPFLFLSALETTLGFEIDSYIKFQSSISVESFLSVFNELHIKNNPIKSISFIDENEIGYFFLIKNKENKDNKKQTNFDLSNEVSNDTSSKYSKKKNLIPKFSINKNVMESRYLKTESDIIMEKTYKTKPNVLKIISKSSNDNKDKNQKGLVSFNSSKIITDNWSIISSYFEMIIPSCLYKLSLKNYENENLYFTSHYSIKSLSELLSWIDDLETYYHGLNIQNGSKNCLIISWLLSFVHFFFFEEDFQEAKDIILKIKDEVKNNLYYVNQEIISIISLFEGMIIEKKSFLECSEYYYQALIHSLILFGDPRGKYCNNNISQSVFIWKVSKQTNLLENITISENFKEMFHCNDYYNKQNLIYSNMVVKAIQKKVNPKAFTAPSENDSYKRKYNLYDPKINLNESDNKTVQDEDIDLDLSENLSHKSSVISGNKTEDAIYSFCNYLPLYLKHIKAPENEQVLNQNEYFGESLSFINLSLIYDYHTVNSDYVGIYNFPSISNTKNNVVFKGLDAGLQILQTIFNCNNTSLKKMTLEENKESLCLESVLDSKIKTISVKSGFNSINSGVVDREVKKNKNNHLLYNILLNKLSYHMNIGNGIVYSFGNNVNNETSHNDYETLSLPRVVYKLKDEVITSIKAGWENNHVINENKRVFSWGNNECGQCGCSLDNFVYGPQLISTLYNVDAISSGNDHSLALVNYDKNEIFSWGKSDGGVLGYMKEKIEYFPKNIDYFDDITLKISKEAFHYEINNISSGSLHNVVVMNEYFQGNYVKNKIFTWGFGEGGQLGFAEKYMNINAKSGFCISPTEIDITTIIKNSSKFLNLNPNLNSIKITKVVCGEAHSLLLTNTYDVYGWGFNSNGQLGLGFCADSFEMGMGMFNSRVFTPRKVPIKEKIIDIEAGKTFSFFISEANHLFGCGVNDLYQLGMETPENNIKHLYNQGEMCNSKCHDIVDPTKVICFYNMKILKISSGESHSIALIEYENIQSLWSWGSNQFGQLGCGTNETKSLPKPISYMMNYDNFKVKSISCGAFHSLVLISGRFESVINLITYFTFFLF